MIGTTKWRLLRTIARTHPALMCKLKDDEHLDDLMNLLESGATGQEDDPCLVVRNVEAAGDITMASDQAEASSTPSKPTYILDPLRRGLVKT